MREKERGAGTLNIGYNESMYSYYDKKRQSGEVKAGLPQGKGWDGYGYGGKG